MKPKCFPQFPLQKRRFSRPVRQCLRTLALEAARLLWAVSTVAWKVVLQSKWHFEVTATEIWMVVRLHHNLLTHHLCCIFAWKQNEKFWEILSWLAHVKRHWQACKAGDFSNHRMKLFFFCFFVRFLARESRLTSMALERSSPAERLSIESFQQLWTSLASVIYFASETRHPSLLLKVEKRGKRIRVWYRD